MITLSPESLAHVRTLVRLVDTLSGVDPQPHAHALLTIWRDNEDTARLTAQQADVLDGAIDTLERLDTDAIATMAEAATELRIAHPEYFA